MAHITLVLTFLTILPFVNFVYGVKGQDNVKRAFEVACAGDHNILLIGSPGSGKSMMAKRLPSILPPLSLAEALETTKIHSVAGSLKSGTTLLTTRPYRAPHHTISQVALVGGGTYPTPGEISLAHNGVLFLDELPEFNRNVLEVMRQPLEDRQITISRAKYSTLYPASFMLVASMNPCPCGYYGVKGKCTCTPSQRQAYMGRLSGPIMDRIDIQLTMRPVPPEDMVRRQRSEGNDNTCQCETSAEIARRVLVARKIQQIRFAGTDVHVNAGMTGEMLGKFCRLSDECVALMEKMSNRLGLSARAFSRVLKLSRTIADLEDAAAMVSFGCRLTGHEDLSGESGFDAMGYDAITLPGSYRESPIAPRHILESFSYRFLDRLER